MVGRSRIHERGEEIHELVVATIRSVSNGVVGVAFLQALALGIGFLVLDVPAAGVLAFAVLFLGVLQLPSSLVVCPFWPGCGLEVRDLRLATSSVRFIWVQRVWQMDCSNPICWVAAWRRRCHRT